jgi:hypothetical protein
MALAQPHPDDALDLDPWRQLAGAVVKQALSDCESGEHAATAVSFLLADYPHTLWNLWLPIRPDVLRGAVGERTAGLLAGRARVSRYGRWTPRRIEPGTIQALRQVLARHGLE